MLTDGADLVDGIETLREDFTAEDDLEGAVIRVDRDTLEEVLGRVGTTLVVRVRETLLDGTTVVVLDFVSNVGRANGLPCSP